MAGKPGMKGGGGRRPGAGRKPKPKAPAQTLAALAERRVEPAAPAAETGETPVQSPLVPAVPDQNPLDFLLAVQNNPLAPLKDRIRAAVAAAQYKHMKTGDGGKKDAQAGKAKAASQGRFAPKAPPKLVVNNQ